MECFFLFLFFLPSFSYLLFVSFVSLLFRHVDGIDKKHAKPLDWGEKWDEK